MANTQPPPGGTGNGNAEDVHLGNVDASGLHTAVAQGLTLRTESAGGASTADGPLSVGALGEVVSPDTINGVDASTQKPSPKDRYYVYPPNYFDIITGKYDHTPTALLRSAFSDNHMDIIDKVEKNQSLTESEYKIVVEYLIEVRKAAVVAPYKDKDPVTKWLVDQIPSFIQNPEAIPLAATHLRKELPQATILIDLGLPITKTLDQSCLNKACETYLSHVKDTDWFVQRIRDYQPSCMRRLIESSVPADLPSLQKFCADHIILAAELCERSELPDGDGTKPFRELSSLIERKAKHRPSPPKEYYAPVAGHPDIHIPDPEVVYDPALPQMLLEKGAAAITPADDPNDPFISEDESIPHDFFNRLEEYYGKNTTIPIDELFQVFYRAHPEVSNKVRLSNPLKKSHLILLQALNKAFAELTSKMQFALRPGDGKLSSCFIDIPTDLFARTVERLAPPKSPNIIGKAYAAVVAARTSNTVVTEKIKKGEAMYVVDEPALDAIQNAVRVAIPAFNLSSEDRTSSTSQFSAYHLLQKIQGMKLGEVPRKIPLADLGTEAGSNLTGLEVELSLITGKSGEELRKIVHIFECGEGSQPGYPETAYRLNNRLPLSGRDKAALESFLPARSIYDRITAIHGDPGKALVAAHRTSHGGLAKKIDALDDISSDEEDLFLVKNLLRKAASLAVAQPGAKPLTETEAIEVHRERKRVRRVALSPPIAVFCSICREEHFSFICPNVGKPYCEFCEKYGHALKDCPVRVLYCTRCAGNGHLAPDCFRIYTCRKCHRVGHYTEDCPGPDKPFHAECGKVHPDTQCPREYNVLPGVNQPIFADEETPAGNRPAPPDPAVAVTPLPFKEAKERYQMTLEEHSRYIAEFWQHKAYTVNMVIDEPFEYTLNMQTLGNLTKYFLASWYDPFSILRPWTQGIGFAGRRFAMPISIIGRCLFIGQNRAELRYAFDGCEGPLQMLTFLFKHMSNDLAFRLMCHRLISYIVYTCILQNLQVDAERTMKPLARDVYTKYEQILFMHTDPYIGTGVKYDLSWGDLTPEQNIELKPMFRKREDQPFRNLWGDAVLRGINSYFHPDRRFFFESNCDYQPEVLIIGDEIARSLYATRVFPKNTDLWWRVGLSLAEAFILIMDKGIPKTCHSVVIVCYTEDFVRDPVSGVELVSLIGSFCQSVPVPNPLIFTMFPEFPIRGQGNIYENTAIYNTETVKVQATCRYRVVNWPKQISLDPECGRYFSPKDFYPTAAGFQVWAEKILASILVGPLAPTQTLGSVYSAQVESLMMGGVPMAPGPSRPGTLYHHYSGALALTPSATPMALPGSADGSSAPSYRQPPPMPLMSLGPRFPLRQNYGIGVGKNSSAQPVSVARYAAAVQKPSAIEAASSYRPVRPAWGFRHPGPSPAKIPAMQGRRSQQEYLDDPQLDLGDAAEVALGMIPGPRRSALSIPKQLALMPAVPITKKYGYHLLPDFGHDYVIDISGYQEDDNAYLTIIEDAITMFSTIVQNGFKAQAKLVEKIRVQIERELRKDIFYGKKGKKNQDWENAEVRVFGSRLTHLGNPESDIDLNVYLPREPGFPMNKSEKLGQLKLIKEHMIRKQTANKVFAGPFVTPDRPYKDNRGPTPVMTMTHRATGLQVQIVINGKIGEVNSKYLRDLAGIDSRFKDFARLMEIFFTYHGLNQASQDSCRSYGALMSVVCELTYRGVLPNLRTLRPPSTTPIGVYDPQSYVHDGIDTYFLSNDLHRRIIPLSGPLYVPHTDFKTPPATSWWHLWYYITSTWAEYKPTQIWDVETNNGKLSLRDYNKIQPTHLKGDGTAFGGTQNDPCWTVCPFDQCNIVPHFSAENLNIATERFRRIASAITTRISNPTLIAHFGTDKIPLHEIIRHLITGEFPHQSSADDFQPAQDQRPLSQRFDDIDRDFFANPDSGPDSEGGQNGSSDPNAQNKPTDGSNGNQASMEDEVTETQNPADSGIMETNEALQENDMSRTFSDTEAQVLADENSLIPTAVRPTITRQSSFEEFNEDSVDKYLPKENEVESVTPVDLHLQQVELVTNPIRRIRKDTLTEAIDIIAADVQSAIPMQKVHDAAVLAPILEDLNNFDSTPVSTEPATRYSARSGEEIIEAVLPPHSFTQSACMDPPLEAKQSAPRGEEDTSVNSQSDLERHDTGDLDMEYPIPDASAVETEPMQNNSVKAVKPTLAGEEDPHTGLANVSETRPLVDSKNITLSEELRRDAVDVFATVPIEVCVTPIPSPLLPIEDLQTSADMSFPECADFHGFMPEDLEDLSDSLDLLFTDPDTAERELRLELDTPSPNNSGSTTPVLGSNASLEHVFDDGEPIPVDQVPPQMEAYQNIALSVAKLTRRGEKPKASSAERDPLAPFTFNGVEYQNPTVCIGPRIPPSLIKLIRSHPGIKVFGLNHFKLPAKLTSYPSRGTATPSTNRNRAMKVSQTKLEQTVGNKSTKPSPRRNIALEGFRRIDNAKSDNPAKPGTQKSLKTQPYMGRSEACPEKNFPIFDSHLPGRSTKLIPQKDPPKDLLAHMARTQLLMTKSRKPTKQLPLERYLDPTTATPKFNHRDPLGLDEPRSSSVGRTEKPIEAVLPHTTSTDVRIMPSRGSKTDARLKILRDVIIDEASLKTHFVETPRKVPILYEVKRQAPVVRTDRNGGGEKFPSPADPPKSSRTLNIEPVAAQTQRPMPEPSSLYELYAYRGDSTKPGRQSVSSDEPGPSGFKIPHGRTYCPNCKQYGHDVKVCAQHRKWIKTLTCPTCKRTGHEETWCPFRPCARCKKSTHRLENCPEPETYPCQCCGNEGHPPIDCPYPPNCTCEEPPTHMDYVCGQRLDNLGRCRECKSTRHLAEDVFTGKVTCPFSKDYIRPGSKRTIEDTQPIQQGKRKRSEEKPEEQTNQSSTQDDSIPPPPPRETRTIYDLIYPQNSSKIKNQLPADKPIAQQNSSHDDRLLNVHGGSTTATQNLCPWCRKPRSPQNRHQNPAAICTCPIAPHVTDRISFEERPERLKRQPISTDTQFNLANQKRPYSPLHRIPENPTPALSLAQLRESRPEGFRPMVRHHQRNHAQNDQR